MTLGYQFYLVLLCASILIGLINFKRLTLRYKLAFFLLFIILATEISTSYISSIGQNKALIYHLLILSQFVFYGFYYGLPQQNKRIYILVFGASIVFGVFCSIWLQKIDKFPSYLLILLSLVMTTAALFDFKRLMYAPVKIKLTSMPDFWFNIGHLVFFSSTFFVFAFINSVVQVSIDWPMRLILLANIFLYTCYGLSLYLDSNQNNEYTA